MNAGRATSSEAVGEAAPHHPDGPGTAAPRDEAGMVPEPVQPEAAAAVDEAVLMQELVEQLIKPADLARVRGYLDGR